MTLFNRLRQWLYVHFLLYLINKVYRIGIAHITGVIPFRVETWKAVNVTVQTPYVVYDYLQANIRMAAALLRYLSPQQDDSQLKPFAAWEMSQQLAVGSYLPVESEQDDSLQDFFWHKTGSFFLQPVDHNNNTGVNSEFVNTKAAWLVDFSYMEQYEVKVGYYRYGGKVYFDSQGQIVGASYQGNYYSTIANSNGDSSSDNNSSRTKLPSWLELVIRATVSVVSIVEVHLCRIHMATAQKWTLQWRNHISADDSLIPLLQVITFNTLTVNRNIPVIMALAENTFALTPAALSQLLIDSVAKGGLIASNSGDDSSDSDNGSSGNGSNKSSLVAPVYGAVGTAWHTKMLDFRARVAELVDGLYPDNVDINLSVNKQLLIDYIMTVSAAHNQFGDAMIANLAVNATFLPAIRMQQPGLMSALEAANLQTMVTVISARLPQFSDNAWYQHFPALQQPACASFQQSLASQNSGWFQPANFEISVGV